MFMHLRERDAVLKHEILELHNKQRLCPGVKFMNQLTQPGSSQDGIIQKSFIKSLPAQYFKILSLVVLEIFRSVDF